MTETTVTQERVRKESFAIGFAAAAILMIGELGVFAIQDWLKSRGVPFAQPRIWLDEFIPFVPEFIFPYWAYFIIIYMCTWLPKTRKEIAQVCGGLLAINAVAWTIFIIYPTQMIRPELNCGEDIACGFTGAMYMLDPGYAVMPSLHVANSVYAAVLFWIFRNPLRWFVVPFGVSIVAATLLVRQHYILDIPAGFVLVTIVGYGAWVWVGNAWDARFADANGTQPLDTAGVADRLA